MPNENHDKLNKLLSRQGSLAERSKLAQELDDDQLQRAAAAGIPQAKEELERRRYKRVPAAVANLFGAPPEDQQARAASEGLREASIRLARHYFGTKGEIILLIILGIVLFLGWAVPEQAKQDLWNFVWNPSSSSTVAPPPQVSPTSPGGLAPLQSRATEKSERKENPPLPNKASTPPEQKESRLADITFGDRWAFLQETPRTWGEAKEFAQDVRINGFAGWRLPTTSEVESFFESGDISSNSPLGTNCYWTADEKGDRASVIFVLKGKRYKTTIEEKNSLCAMLLIREYH